MYNLKDEIQPLDVYARYRKQFLDMLTKFQFMWNGHLEQLFVAKHCIELTPQKIQPITSVPDQVGTKARELENAEIDKNAVSKSH